MEKTIPYTPSLADLETFRILRKKIKTFDSNEDGEQENRACEFKAKDSDPEPMHKTVGTNTP
jgi:hypothetical protein